MIGALLRLPWEAVAHRILSALHEHGFDDIDAPHLGVILWPGPDGMRPSDLAARMRVTKQALNYLLGSLERLGYLERRPDPNDGRARRIVLTDRGRSLVPVVRNAVRDVEREWADELGRERFTELRELLLELTHVVAPELRRP
jgi:DNA-binding MarR family transcriptional regulator